jgi:hypothetical protein
MPPSAKIILSFSSLRSNDLAAVESTSEEGASDDLREFLDSGWRIELLVQTPPESGISKQG